MTDPKMLGGRLLFPENDSALFRVSDVEEDGAWVDLSFLVVVWLRWSEGREVEVGLTNFVS